MSTSAFWELWARDHYRARKPAVFRQPFARPVATAEEGFAWLLAASEKIRGTDPRAALRIFSKGKFLLPTAELHPRASDGSVAGYSRRLTEQKGETGIVLNNLHLADEPVWRWARSVMASVMDATGVSTRSAMLDLFAGAYRVGFFGVHKDEQEVITFVLEGRKRFLAWPYHVFAGRPEVGGRAGGELASIALGALDLARHRHDAVVLEADPGDVIYWPTEYWHVSEAVGGGEHVTTLGLGFLLADTGMSLDERAAREVSREARPGDPQRRIQERVLAHKTSFGFAMLPDPLPAQPLPAGARVRLAARDAVAYLVAGDELLWAVSGTVFRRPRSAAIERLLELVTAGGELDVDALVAELADASTTAAALREVLAVLRRHHAFAA